MTATAQSRFSLPEPALCELDTVRIMGELVELVMTHDGSMTGYRFHPGIDLREMGTGKVLLTGPGAPEKIPGQVKAIVYRAYDNRTAPDTKGKDVIHIFREENAPELKHTPEGTWLAGGDYLASCVGIIG